MFLTMLVRDNRPEAVSSAHWGDRDNHIAHRPAAMSSANGGDVALASSDSVLFQAVLNSLAPDVLALPIQQKVMYNPPGFFTCKSRVIPTHQSNESMRKKTAMQS